MNCLVLRTNIRFWFMVVYVLLVYGNGPYDRTLELILRVLNCHGPRAGP
jgi:hypothetical protein